MSTHSVQGPGYQRADSCETGSSSASQKTTCHFHLFPVRPPELETNTLCACARGDVPIHTLSKHKEQMKKGEWQSGDSPLFTELFSHMWYSMRTLGVVLTCVYCASECVCVFVCTTELSVGSEGVCALLDDICTQPLFSGVWTVAVMNLKQSAKQWGLCRWFPWFRGGGGGITHYTTARETRRMFFPMCYLCISGEQSSPCNGRDRTGNVAFVDYTSFIYVLTEECDSYKR